MLLPAFIRAMSSSLEWRADPPPSIGIPLIGLGQRRPDDHARPAPCGDSSGPADNRREACRLTEEATTEPIRLALNIADPTLADRLAAFGGCAGSSVGHSASRRKFL